jgi:signal transduction histidine kinase
VSKSASAALERARVLSPPSVAALSPDAAQRELMAVREIVHAFLTAERPEEVFQFALERVSPVVGASLASVYLVDGASELMRLAAVYNWPKRFEPWLGEMRVRLGFGPSGEAASERRAIEVPDVFADPNLEDWQEVASELGFRAFIALPLQTGSRVLGAVTFYFADARGLGAERRGLLRIVAGQMAATAEKAALFDELRRANAALTESKVEIEQQYLAVVEARRVKDEFLNNVTHELRTPLMAVMSYIALLQDEFSGPLTDSQRHDLALARDASERLLSLIDNLIEITALKGKGVEVQIETFDPRDPLKEAATVTQGRPPSTELALEFPAEPVQFMRSDRRKLTKILSSLLSNAYKFTARGVVAASLEVANGRALYRVQDTGIGVPAQSQRIIFEEFRQLDGSLTRPVAGTGLGLALARRLARLLGGDIDLVSVPGEGATFTVEIPLEYQPADVPAAG